MANSKTAKKRIRINKRNQIQNNSYKGLIRRATKQYITLLKNPENSNRLVLRNHLDNLHSRIDKAQKKNVLHKNTAARKKSKLSKLFNKAFS